ncbi:MAG TPA: hypothetical protein VK860_03205 [Ilumatobacteraceae bacterium]|jgi:hypothetical protein|nr:hypothetical protein [Ilumatobacteraceae bacterium]
MPSHQFLSDEWFEEVRELKSSVTAPSVDAPGMVVNATITDVPFGEGTLELHSARGPMIGWAPGHAAAASLSLVVDYHTARALVLDSSDNMAVLDQATRTGALRIEGDSAALREWFAKRSTGPEAAALEDEVRAITY